MAVKKIILNMLEDQVLFEYDSAEVFTSSYSSKIRPRSIHVPTSAKIIFTRKNVMTVLLVQLPIIKVDKEGTINIHTHTNYKTASLANAEEHLAREDLKLLKARLSAVYHKKAFGSTSLEIIKEKELALEIELIQFIKKIRKFTEGGGF